MGDLTPEAAPPTPLGLYTNLGGRVLANSGREPPALVRVPRLPGFPLSSVGCYPLVGCSVRNSFTFTPAGAGTSMAEMSLMVSRKSIIRAFSLKLGAKVYFVIMRTSLVTWSLFSIVSVLSLSMSPIALLSSYCTSLVSSLTSASRYIAVPRFLGETVRCPRYGSVA